ncbi:hypothetical protein AX769_11930 [Frondihabitans sp. PAMC 28766]|uniref:hypothetical protein n=1 Tax=Frondihabitans sp. PAMC 28766 TaxID=1795630 RepID=UPI00078CAF4E|nr:hypothetical protein [Frondihabitans sp. PAMC 28766]AMM20721.1 hypothetical protein AX769_11930 [Frondihabitans sp. PAMC 28766]
MSTDHALATSFAEPDDTFDDFVEAPTRRRSPIEIVTSRAQRTARPRMVYALIATAALFVLLLTQLGISIALSNGAYQVSALQNEQTVLSRSQQKYTEKLGVLSSPQNIANNATALGMVRNQDPVYLDLQTEAVYGTPTAASKDAAASGNLVANSLLKGVPVVTKKATPKATTPAASTADSKSATGAATANSGSSSVASSANQLTAPQTR